MNPSDLLLITFLLLPAAALAGFVLLYRRRGQRRWGAARLVAGNLLLLVFLAGLLVAGADDPGRMRVTVLGDSFTNGHGVKQVADRPGWEVHSFAEDGMDTGPILARLKRLTATGYRLDVVVYVYCLNDISDLIPEWAAAASRLYEERPGYLVRNSYVINTWYYRLRISNDPELTGYFDRIAQAYDGPTWDLQARRLRALHQRIVAAGGRLLVVGFPFFEHREDPMFNTAQARLAGLWAEMEVPYLDLRPVFEGRSTAELSVNRYDSHPNPEAHGLAAAAIEAFIERETAVQTPLQAP